MKQRQQKKRVQVYRQRKAKRQESRIDIYVSHKFKTLFEKLAEEKADEYDEPYDIRVRKAQAKKELLEKAIQHADIQFQSQQERVQTLEQQLAAVAPNFFKPVEGNDLPLPDAITQLPNEPNNLKKLIAKYYRAASEFKHKATELIERNKKLSELLEAQDGKLDAYEKVLKEKGIVVPGYDLLSI